MPTEITRPAVSLEYVEAQVSANIPLGSQDVNMAVIDSDTTLDSGDFSAASWVLSAGTTNIARRTAATYTRGTYDVYVQIEGSPEIPVLYAGRLTVT